LLSCLIVGPVLGLADAALARALDQVRGRGEINGTPYRRAADSPAVQIAVATAAGHIDTARLHASRAVADVSAAIRSRTVLDAVSAARIRMDAGIVSANVRQAVGLLLDVSGARTFASSSPLQRIWRDVEVACRHQLLVPDVSREAYGRALLDVD
jgi:alkylation response protein AidB-like acyl-CoA dehydrogenase